MGIKDYINRFFGGKPWYQSVTAWGLVIFSLGSSVVSQVCDAGLMDYETCVAWKGYVTTIGAVITGLGLRRAGTAPNIG